MREPPRQVSCNSHPDRCHARATKSGKGGGGPADPSVCLGLRGGWQVIDVCKKFMGETLATGYNDPRVTLVRAFALGGDRTHQIRISGC